MTPYSLTPDVQVSGDGVQSFIEGFGAFSLLASRILHESGFCELDDAGMVKTVRAGWYPLQAALRAYARIERELGSHVVYRAGLAMPKHVIFPEDIRDLEGALRSINVVYHFGHALRGERLFDPATGA